MTHIAFVVSVVFNQNCNGIYRVVAGKEVDEVTPSNALVCPIITLYPSSFSAVWVNSFQILP